MDKEKAKAFILDASLGERMGSVIYKSKNLQKLLDMNDGSLCFIYAIIDTGSGETLMNMDWSYSGEPIIMDRFIHWDFFKRYHNDKEVVDLDKQ